MLQKGKDSMAKKLVIVESPHKSKTIEKYLGSEYKVVSSVGHIRDLSTSGKFGFGVDIDNNFKPDYQIIKGKNKIVKENRTYEVEEKEVDNTLISFLKNKIESKNKTYSLGEEVQKFIDKHKKDFEMVSKSQWGQIRMIVQFYKDDYKNKILEFITKIEKKEEEKKNEKSTPKKHWEKGFDSLKRLLDDEKKDIEFIKLLSMMMPKVKIEDEKNDK